MFVTIPFKVSLQKTKVDYCFPIAYYYKCILKGALAGLGVYDYPWNIDGVSINSCLAFMMDPLIVFSSCLERNSTTPFY